MLAQTTLRAVLGQHELDEMLSERKKLNVDVQAILDAQTETWGIKVSNVEIRTVELTDNMVRAIAKQAEAERDRRAKIIHAEAEFQSSQTLVDAARILGSVPAAMQLRYLQTLTEIGAEQNSTGYAAYARVLKWLTLALFAYVAVVFTVHVPWSRAVLATLVPHLVFDGPHAMALVAVLGTTISPYLFFWQSSLEVEDRLRRGARPLCLEPQTAGPQLVRIRWDTLVGMGVSNVVAVFIIYATAATLNASGVTDIQTSSQAAEALRPVAGELTFAVFAAGIIGTGLLAVPVLAGSAAYAVSETLRWRTGLDRRLLQAKSFYAVIAASTLAGVGLNFTTLDPVRALYWSAVVNGVLAAPVMAAVMLAASNGRIMGRLTVPRPMLGAGWLATAAMAAASIAFFVL